MKNKINPIQELQILDQASAAASGTRKDHVRIQQAVENLREYIEEIEKSKNDKTDTNPQK